MSKAAGDPNPYHTPLPSSAQTEDIKKGETEMGRWMHCIWRDGGRWAKAGLKVTVSRCKKTPSRKYPPPPPSYFCSTCLYVLFHLKVPTTHPETRMDRKKGRGRERCTICQNNATMLQAAVCLNISVGREGKKWSFWNMTGRKVWR